MLILLLEQNSFQGKVVWKKNIKTVPTITKFVKKIDFLKSTAHISKDIIGFSMLLRKRPTENKNLLVKRPTDKWPTGKSPTTGQNTYGQMTYGQKTYGTKDPHGKQTINI